MRQFLLMTVFSSGCLALGPSAEVVKVAAPEVPDTGPRPDLDQVTKAIVEKTNEFRQAKKREAVGVNELLTATAKGFAEFMAKSDEYGHTAGGKQPAERVQESGYECCVVLENIAYAFDSEGFRHEKLTETFVSGWKDSPGHRRNMLDPDVTETGVAVARSARTGHYYAVQLFARPKAQAIVFEIVNGSGQDVRYVVGGQSFTLETRATQTHTLCRPEVVDFQWPGGASESVTPARGERYTVSRNGEKWAVSRLKL